MMDNYLPDGRRLSDVQLAELRSEAEEWTRRMLEEACLPATGHAEDAVNAAIMALVAIYVKYGTMSRGHVVLSSKGVDEQWTIYGDLVDKLYDIVCAYSQAATEDEDDKAWLLLFIGKPFNDYNTLQRIKARTGVLLTKVYNAVNKRAEESGAVSGDGITPDGITGIKNIKRLIGSEVTRAWQAERRRENADARYVHVYRGSSFDCEMCDDVVAKGWQPIDDAEIPPIHANCRCYAVYV